MYNFDAVKVKNDLIQWIRDWFETNGKGCNAVIGLSGGKDSLIALVLCVEALGKDRVVAVAMPDGEQSENGAREIAEFYGVRYMVVNIGETVKAVKNSILSTNEFTEALSVQSIQNIPPRVRMTTLYAVSQSLNGRVSNHCNFSENFIGYCTVFGDSAGDFAPLANITVTELYAIADALGIPKEFIKIPYDGLPHSKPDEEKFGFTYKELDMYIREGIEPQGYCHNNPNEELKIDKIKRMHVQNLFKLKPIASFLNEL